MYAEVYHKQPSRRQRNDLLELDDTRVEYAQLKHCNQLVNTCDSSQTESQPALAHQPNGMIFRYHRGGSRNFGVVSIMRAKRARNL
jgi:hypothetical protein